ncbi:IS1595 family transposase [Brevundimonas diminuta]|uniref:IS1595 family transposase n=1 Tax=Brevundimonas TaxID=41275 RepID=UPI001902E6AD|nr:MULTISPECIES: IS1595 family transposase [Brevundimonas]MBK1976864.1 IS1595 family transposase [Brevundimonas diminuta]MDA0743384.1 IS1595 family transposase [Pseudomonadota bacterium]
MSQAVSEIGQAKALTPFNAPRDPVAARELFVRMRFSDTNGRPACPKCSCDAVYTFKTRDLYKCKRCTHQFSPTSGTFWAYRKLPYDKIIFMIARFCEEADGLSATSMADCMGVHYKTVFTWFHKFRDAISKFAQSRILTGEVEIDGGEFGGFIRPKNLKKEREDHRKFPYRAADRTMHAVVCKSRDGPILTWVAKHESHPRTQIEKVLANDAVLFTDKAASWNRFRGKWKLFQVNHSVSYATPEACTNGAESLIRTIRSAENNYRHITQNYFDFYTAEAGWRVEFGRAKGKKKQRAGSLMSAMSRPGRSELAGYFQGRKRLCSYVTKEGDIAGWRPPTREERDNARLANGKQVHSGPLRSSRNSKNWQDGFNFIDAATFIETPATVPDRPGVCVVLLKDTERMLSQIGFIESPGHPLWTHGGCQHVYTGETYGLRTRLTEHMTGSSEGASLRQSLLALHFARAWGSADFVVTDDRGRTEDSLSEWLKREIVIGYKQSAYVRDYEADILSWTASPLNIARRVATPSATALKALRERLRNEVIARWEPLPTRSLKRMRH